MINQTKIKVLFIVHNLARGGAETQVVDLINSMDDARFNKYLFTFLSGMDQYERLNLNSITFYTLERKNKFDVTVIRKIADIIQREKIDIIHCTIQYSLLMAFTARLISARKPKLVCALHTTINKSKKGELFDRFVYVPLMRYCDKIIFVSKNQAQHWENKYPCLSNKHAIIHNGVNVNHFDPSGFAEAGRKLREKLSIPPEASVISCIAGFREEKGHEILIEAFFHLGHNVFLVLAGDGERRHHVETLVKLRGLEHRVRFLGQVRDVRPVLAASDVSVLASISVETFSIAMLESMSMEVPVVATNIGGLSEAILPGETGDLVPPNNALMLGAALDKALQDTRNSESIKRKCREMIKTNFTLEKMALTTENLLVEVAKLEPA